MKIKNIFLEKIKQQKGGILVENKLLLVIGAILIFGAGSLLISGLQDYFDDNWKDVGKQGTKGEINEKTHVEPIDVPNNY